jgi:hypothetical protein
MLLIKIRLDLIFTSLTAMNSEIILPDSLFMVSIYNSNSKEVFSKNAQTTNMAIKMANFLLGIYIVKITGQHQTIVKK